MLSAGTKNLAAAFQCFILTETKRSRKIQIILTEHRKMNTINTVEVKKGATEKRVINGKGSLNNLLA